MAATIARVRSALAYAPQWWMWAASALAWLWLAAAEAAARGWLGRGMQAPVWQAICAAPRPAAAIWQRAPEAAAWGAGWLCMVVAMMFPLLGEPVRSVAFASPRRRRHRAIALFLAGYTVPWIGFGALLAALLATLLATPASAGAARYWPVAAACGFALAATWVWMPARLLALVACGRTMPLRTRGRGADADCLRYGAMMGKVCVVTCWAPMVALMLAHHGLAQMAMVALLIGYERHYLHHKSKLIGYVWAAAAAWSLALALA